MTKPQRREIRSLLHEAERALPRKLTPNLEREIDLLATAAVAVWEPNLPKLTSCLVRLGAQSHDPSKYLKILNSLR